MGSLLDFISNICPITGIDIIDTILFAVITGVSLKVAWFATGSISDGIGSHDSGFMSFLHWLIRPLVFVVLLAAIIGLVHLIRWVTSWEWWVYLIVAVVGILITVGIIVLVHFAKKRKNKKTKNEDVEDNEKE